MIIDHRAKSPLPHPSKESLSSTPSSYPQPPPPILSPLLQSSTPSSNPQPPPPTLISNSLIPQVPRSNINQLHIFTSLLIVQSLPFPPSMVQPKAYFCQSLTSLTIILSGAFQHMPLTGSPK